MISRSSINHCLMARDEMTTGKMPSSEYLALQVITHAVRPRNGNEFATSRICHATAPAAGMLASEAILTMTESPSRC